MIREILFKFWQDMKGNKDKDQVIEDTIEELENMNKDKTIKEKEQYEKGFKDGSGLTGRMAEEVLAQKEKDVKAEIRKAVEGMKIKCELEHKQDEYPELCGACKDVRAYNEAIEAILKLL